MGLSPERYEGHNVDILVNCYKSEAVSWFLLEHG